MATFQYIKGNNELTGIPNAQKYVLFRRHGNSESNYTYDKLAEQEVIQNITVPGSMYLGEELRRAKHVPMSGGEGVVSGIFPLRRLTETGYRYYVRFKGEMTVNIEGRVPIEYQEFVGDLDLGESPEGGSQFIIFESMEIRADGIYLRVATGVYVNVYKIDTSSWGENSTARVVSNEVVVYERDANYRHTEYIPLQCLTDSIDWTGSGYYKACVGPFDVSNDDDNKITFYNKNLKYLGVVKASEIRAAKEAGDIFSSEYLSYDDVAAFGDRFYDSSNVEETTPFFVVFSSALEENTDKVSVGEVYFPMFALERDLVPGKLSADETNVLVVKAIGDGFFYLDSPYSEPIDYDCQYSYQ